VQNLAQAVFADFLEIGAVTMNSDVDFAVAAWHEGGTWNLEMLSDPYNLGSAIKELQSH
jgi:hypothetical protein